VQRFVQRSGSAHHSFHLPERIAAVNALFRAQKVQRSDFGQHNQFALLQFRRATRKGCAS